MVVGNSSFSLQLWWEASPGFSFVEPRRRDCVPSEQEVGAGVEVFSCADDGRGLQPLGPTAAVELLCCRSKVAGEGAAGFDRENRGEEERKRGEENYNLPSCLYDDIHRNIIMILMIKTRRAESADNHASSQIDSSVYLSHHLHRLGNSKLLGLLTALPANRETFQGLQWQLQGH